MCQKCVPVTQTLNKNAGDFGAVSENRDYEGAALRPAGSGSWF